MNNTRLLKSGQHYLILAILSCVIFYVFRLNLPFITSEDLLYTSATQSPISLIASLAYDVPIEGYRPLDVYLSHNIAYLVRIYGDAIFPLVALIPAIVTALTLLIIFNISLKITNNLYAAYGAAFINFFSIIFITGLLNSYTLFYILPHLLNTLAFFGYFQYITSNNRFLKKYFLIIAILSCFIAPLFREAGFIGSFTIVGCEVIRYILFFLKKTTDKPSIKTSFLFLLLLLHSIAPKTIFYITKIYTGSFDTLFGMERASAINNTSSITLNLIRFVQLLFELPPLLWLVLLLGISSLLYRYFSSLKKHFPIIFFNKIIEEKIQFKPTIIISIFVVLSSIFIASFFSTNIAVLFFFIIALTSFLTINPYLTIWAVFSVAPALLLHNTHIYLNLFFISSFSALSAISIYSAYLFIKKNITHGKIRNILLSSFVIIIAISSMDFMGNYFSSYFATRHIDEKHQEIAAWLRKNAPQDSVIATNFFPGRDILLKSVYKTNDDKLNIPKENEAHFEIWYATNDLSYNVFYGKKNRMLKELKRGIFKKLGKEKKDIYFILLESYNTDNGLYLPHTKLKLLQTYNIHNFILRIDPLRHLVFNKNYFLKFNTSIATLPENPSYNDYDTSYRYTFYGEKHNFWSSVVKIYKLSHKDLPLLNEADFSFKQYNLPK